VTTGEVLAAARSQAYRAGENVRGATTGALWLLTVPSIESIRSIARIGEASSGELAMLRAVVEKVTVVPDAAALSRLSARQDVVFATASALGRRADPSLRGIAAAADDAGSTMVEARGLRASGVAASLRGARGEARTATLRSFPLRGPIRTILPARDRDGLSALARAGLLRA